MKTSPTCSSRTLLYVLLVLSTAAYSSGLNIACAFKNAFAGHPASLKVFFYSVCDWQGAYFAWKATAMGKNYVNGKTFLEKRYT